MPIAVERLGWREPLEEPTRHRQRATRQPKSFRMDGQSLKFSLTTVSDVNMRSSLRTVFIVYTIDRVALIRDTTSAQLLQMKH